MKISVIISALALLLSVEIISYAVLTFWGFKLLGVLFAAMAEHNIV